MEARAQEGLREVFHAHSRLINLGIALGPVEFLAKTRALLLIAFCLSLAVVASVAPSPAHGQGAVGLKVFWGLPEDVPPTIAVPPGGPEVVGANVTSINGFEGPVWLDASGLPDGLEWWFEPNPLFIPAGGFNISCLIMSAFEHIETGLYEVSVSVLDYETLEPLATTPFLLNITPAAPVRAYDLSRPGLVPDDQHERIAWGTHWCTPTAIGICLWGFRAFREKFATKEDLIDAVGKALGTHPFRGTRSDQIKPRLEQFFRAHGVPLVVKEYRTPSFNDMLREFVENREDVSFCVDCRHRVLLSALDRRKTGATWRGEIIDPATGTRVPVRFREVGGRLQVFYRGRWREVSWMIAISPIVSVHFARANFWTGRFVAELHNNADKPMHIRLRFRLVKVIPVLIIRRVCYMCGIAYVVERALRIVVVERTITCITLQPCIRTFVFGALPVMRDPLGWELHAEVLVNETVVDELHLDAQAVGIWPGADEALKFYVHNPSEEQSVNISIQVDGLSGWEYYVAPGEGEVIELGANETLVGQLRVVAPGELHEGAYALATIRAVNVDTGEEVAEKHLLLFYDASPPEVTSCTAELDEETLTLTVRAEVEDAGSGVDPSSAVVAYSTDGGSTWSYCPMSVVSSEGPILLEASIGPFAYETSVQYKVLVSDKVGNTAEAPVPPGAYLMPRDPLEDEVAGLSEQVSDLQERVRGLEEHLSSLEAMLPTWQMATAGALVGGLAIGALASWLLVRKKRA